MSHNIDIDITLTLDDNETYDAPYVAASTSNQKINSDLEAKWKDLPDRYLMIIAQFLAGHINDTDAYERFNGPILKSSIKSVYWIFLIQYALLAMLGIFMNIAIIAYIMYSKLYRDVTHAFIINLAVCHFVQCAIVLPITLMVMLIQNWIFGQFLCFFLPMLQDIPLHVAMISHILIAWDRMRWLGDPLKGRLPAFVCCCATWLTGMVIALPYPIYTIYVEIGDYVPRLNGIGVCVVNLMDDIHEYMRGLFLIMYCGPSILLAYLYIRTSQELRPPDGPFAVMMFEHRAEVRNRQRNSSSSSVERSFSGTTTTTGIGTGMTTTTTATGAGTRTNGHSAISASTRSFDLYSAELDVYREKRKQRNLGSMAAAQVVCLCPLMILRLARMVMEETYDNTKHFDFTFLMFVWIAFLPTVIFPCIYASQILPRNEQERLRGYFRLSTKRLKKSRSAIDSGHSPDSREDSIEKDDNTNTTQATSILPNSEGYIEGVCKGDSRNRNELRTGSAKYQHHNNCRNAQGRQGKKEKLLTHMENDRNSGSKKESIKINVISDSSTKLNTTRPAIKSAYTAAAKSTENNQRSGMSTQRRLTIESVDNNSCSNVTSSTYCNGNSTLLGDGDCSNFGDGEDSSIVSGMIVQGGSSAGSSMPPHYVKKWSAASQSMQHKDLSFSDCGSFTRMDSSSTLERDMEIIDRLERERSMDIQEMIEREQRGEPIRLSSERRRLPDIEKIYRSPKTKIDPYSYDKLALTRTASTASAKELRPSIASNSSELSCDILLSNNETYRDASTVNEDAAHAHSLLTEEDEEVPADFFDKYTPGGDTLVAGVPPPIMPNPYQYQYSRRLSRKSSHHSQGSSQSHRTSKRDSFNSLNGGDLIAGAFGELDPTQPLTKMSVIENRMQRRTSGRTSSFSSSGRSSLKSRDYNHGSMHSAHPELDFRENIFAEL